MSDFIESTNILNEAINELGYQLRKIMSLFLPSTPDKVIWDFVNRFCRESARMTRQLETMAGTPLQWNNLESWLKLVREALDERRTILKSAITQGIELPSLKNRSDIVGTMEFALRDNAQFKLTEAMYGPNWPSQHERIILMSGLSSSNLDTHIPIDKVQPRVKESAERILSLWNTLRDLGKRNNLGYFQKKWTLMQPQARHSWLQQLFPRLHPYPNSCIYLLAQHHSGIKDLDKEPFMTSLLNLEDLAQADVLPEMLQVRLNFHPRLFLTTDARHVDLGYWCGALIPMQIAGRISFPFTMGTENSKYEIQSESNGWKRPDLLNPCIGLYQLMAQEKTYEFLVSCLSTPLEPPIPYDSQSRSTTSGTSLSLLDRSARLGYGRPDCIDWAYLQNVLEASADEAKDDLWHLRTDAEYWLMRIMQMQKNSSKLLLSVFDRIDIYLTLSQQMKNCENKNWNVGFLDGMGNTIPSDDTPPLRNVISMHSTLRSILNEALASMQDKDRSPIKDKSITFCYLFDMMKKNDPTLRVMGLHTVLRIIEREISNGETGDPIPFCVRQAFNDMSIMAVCMQETSKHYNFVRNIDNEYASSAEHAQAEWKGRERPWVSLIQSTLKKLDHRVNKLNELVSNDNRSLDERHSDFWMAVDLSMKDIGPSPIVNMIQAAIHTKPTVSPNIAIPEWTRQDLGPTLTKTRVKKSKGRTVPLETSALTLRKSVSAPPAAEPRWQPTVYIKAQKDKAFWSELKNTKGQKSFTNWCEFLTNIGYTKTPQNGSGYRFELVGSQEGRHAIVFHDIHGKHGKKVSYKIARQSWAGRLEKYVQIVPFE